jgi:hypothetical protein
MYANYCRERSRQGETMKTTKHYLMKGITCTITTYTVHFTDTCESITLNYVLRYLLYSCPCFLCMLAPSINHMCKLCLAVWFPDESVHTRLTSTIRARVPAHCHDRHGRRKDAVRFQLPNLPRSAETIEHRPSESGPTARRHQ